MLRSRFFCSNEELEQGVLHDGPSEYPSEYTEKRNHREIRLKGFKAVNASGGDAGVVFRSHTPATPPATPPADTPTQQTSDLEPTRKTASSRKPVASSSEDDCGLTDATESMDVSDANWMVVNRPTPPTRALVAPLAGRVLVFDTETANLRGLVIQLCYTIYDPSGLQLDQRTKYLRLPRGETIGWGAYKIHNISARTVAQHGVEPLAELARFARACDAIMKENGRVVAHNASFDCRAVRYTWSRNAGAPGGEDALPNAHLCVCTMQKAKGHVPVTDSRGKIKAPKNSELYQHLFHTSPEADAHLLNSGTGKLHDAAFDVSVTARCYFEGRQRRWWD